MNTKSLQVNINTLPIKSALNDAKSIEITAPTPPVSLYAIKWVTITTPNAQRPADPTVIRSYHLQFKKIKKKTGT